MYNALICKLTNVRKHPNADRLNLAEVNGYTIVTGLSSKDGDIGVYFGEGGQLSHKMCYENNLYSNKELNKDVTKSGFFGTNRRVRSQKFRGEKSDGFWTELSSLSWAGDITKFKENDSFDTIEGEVICNKYYTPETLRRMNQNKKKTKQIQKYDYSLLLKHYNTKQIRDNIHRIPNQSVLYITEKCHGTSGRTGYIKVYKKLSRFKSWWNKHFNILKINDSSWVYISGTRKTIMRPEEHYDGGYYKDSTFRQTIHDQIKEKGLHKGETLYYEIVGYTHNAHLIMPPHHNEDSKLIKKYGTHMNYTYGCSPNENKILIYRITQINEDGVQFELSWPQVKNRAKELGIDCVPELEGPFVYDGNQQGLLDLLKRLSDGTSVLDQRHIREGVVVRVEHSDMFEGLKYKGWTFCDLEGIRKNSDDYVDEEEIS